jgi:peptidoglycan hydrolase-like protein with peptidoglycan-binding domain
MLHRLRTNTSGFAPTILVIVIVLVVVAAGGVLLARHSSKSTTTSKPSACVNQSFTAGSSGSCVSDLQNMVNSQAFGIDGQLYIKVSGNYDTATTSAVKTFQKNFNLPQTGSITTSDWKHLCNSDGDSSTSFVTASKAAGC